jgi:DNA repair exonuclease SbcCD ATPase subunit
MSESDEKYVDLNEDIKDQQKKKEALDGRNKEQEILNAEAVGLEAKVSEMRKKLVAGISTITELTAEIKKLDKEIKDYSDTKTKYQEAAQKARDSYTEARSLVASAQKEVSSAKKDFDTAQASLEKGLEKSGFATEEEAKALMLDADERKALTSKISTFDAELMKESKDLEKYRKELAKKDEPDKEKCEQAIQGAIDAKTEYAKKHETLKNEITRLTKKCKRLEADSSGIEQEEAQAEEDYIFAKKLRGDSGISLQRYVLGIMFSSVVAAANRMLEMVHGGRYRLFRSDDKNQGNKTGLELKVFDKNSEDHEGRFVNTLSGGEKFLTSLALSIGLSTVAQKSGIKIEALFIDEGFGSLDEDSIVDAMNVLNSIQKANGMVGIISHVQILQERIPTKLKVEDTPEGRHIVQTIG